MVENIAENLTKIYSKIAAAQERSPYAADKVQLLAVSKTYPMEQIEAAASAGQTAFGENRVQELIDKYTIRPDLEWHLIGHLQTNKVKYIVGKVHLIHSLDNLELAHEIEKRSAARGVNTHALVQVNIAREETKSGIFEEELEDFLDSLYDFPHLRIEGLMTIGPHVEDREEIRQAFTRLRQLRDEQREIPRPTCRLSLLSMGMSGDYEIAVEEGANIVRVGTAIFGQRSYF